ncbi:hypothetical protein AX17_006156 [Amanita inopinata Kibby_2008]|nr:hypothetical protein AX17_006156 [Amanita inopinata Kibby_2008]
MLRKLIGIAALASVANASLIFLNSTGSLGKQVLNRTSFDYIIVGGGTTGLTVARRLSELPDKRVLVLEAGRSGVNDTLVTIPENSFHFIGTDIDWFYFTSPQAHASNRTINLSSGKILGGDSAVNGLVWVRPPKAEYDAFEVLGNEGWNWDSMYAAMKKSETLDQPTAVHAAEYGYSAVPSSHGDSGPVQASFPPFIPLQHQKFINASISLGHQFNTDPYSGYNTGAFWSLSSETRNATRETSEFAYLDPVLTRNNLVVLAQALVTEIEFKERYGNVTADGVRVRFPDGTDQLAQLANGGEVIMSAGTFRNPQLLELSGIGNKDILNKFGIKVKVDLPGVGQNYEDHTITILTYKLKPGYLSFDALSYNATLVAEQKALYQKGEGWFTFANSGIVMSPVDKILNATEMKTAVQILSQKPASIPQDQFEIIREQIFGGIPQAEFLLFNSFSAGTNKQANTSYASMAITHVHPLSRGSVHINSTSIDDHPLIDLNILAAEWDKWFLAKATAYGRRFFETESMKEVFDPVEVFPGSDVQTEEQWEQYVTGNVYAGYHSVGTASMLPQGNNGVVDAKLKVYGTTNLRVADASIMPLLISAHTQTAAYAIGERAAEIIGSS